MTARSPGATRRSCSSDGALAAPDGASEQLEDAFRRLGVGAIEEYAENMPHGVSPTPSGSSTRARAP